MLVSTLEQIHNKHYAVTDVGNTKVRKVKDNDIKNKFRNIK
jgi:hypothetical protein